MTERLGADDEVHLRRLSSLGRINRLGLFLAMAMMHG